MKGGSDVDRPIDQASRTRFPFRQAGLGSPCVNERMCGAVCAELCRSSEGLWAYARHTLTTGQGDSRIMA
jgi:hypothetical protein